MADKLEFILVLFEMQKVLQECDRDKCTDSVKTMLSHWPRVITGINKKGLQKTHGAFIFVSVFWILMHLRGRTKPRDSEW